MNMAKRNIASGAFLLCVTCWYGWMTLGLPSRDIMPNTPGPSFFPWLIAGLTAILSILLIIKGMRGLAIEMPTIDNGSFWLPAIMLTGFLAYIIGIKVTGFVLTSILFFGFMMWMFTERRIVRILVSSLVAPIALYLIFSKGFQVLLPVGPFGI